MSSSPITGGGAACADAAAEAGAAGGAPAHLSAACCGGTTRSGGLKNPIVKSGAGALAHVSGADDADGGVVGRELLVLLERLAKGAQPGGSGFPNCPFTSADTHIGPGCE